jgi:hypothetical protein
MFRGEAIGEMPAATRMEMAVDLLTYHSRIRRVKSTVDDFSRSNA